MTDEPGRADSVDVVAGIETPSSAGVVVEDVAGTEVVEQSIENMNTTVVAFAAEVAHTCGADLVTKLLMQENWTVVCGI